MTNNNIDLSSLSDDQRMPAISAAYQVLEGNDTLIIKSSDDFFLLMCAFQQQFWGEYDWYPVQAGPDQWIGEIIKLEAIRKPDSVMRLMHTEHSHCDQLYADGETALGEDRIEVGEKSMRSFIAGMRRHFEMEEKVLFPAFEALTGMVGGPPEVMRMEHQQIRGVLDQLSEVLDAQQYDPVFSIGETLMILIQQHNMKEENMLYPMIDNHLGNQVDELLKQMQLLGI
ncbi:MAG: hemerythrin domain-containing protein [SAR324 cluster bacterium]|nr:hemerythrin domain-containing protein [SAR324 cluster bacterium]